MPFSTFPAGTLPGQRTMQGARKPPSSTVPLPPANGVWPPSGQVKFSAPLSVEKTTIVSSSRPRSFSFCASAPDDVVELRHARLVDAPPVLGVAHAVVLLREVRHHVHARRVQPHEERLALVLGAIDEAKGVVQDLVVDGAHAVGVQRAGVLDVLLADLAPARIDVRIVDVGGPAVQHVARSDLVLQRLRVGAVRRVLHRVQVIEVAEELVESVQRGQELVAVAQVILAELSGRVAHALERGRDRRRLGGHTDRWRPPARPSSDRSGSGAAR